MNSKSSILKIFASSTDKIGTKLFYEYLVHAAKDFGISGATVYRGIMGYGTSTKISNSKFWELTEKLPLVIELIDDTQKLEAFYDQIKEVVREMPKGCLITMEPIEILLHKSGNKKK